MSIVISRSNPWRLTVAGEVVDGRSHVCLVEIHEGLALEVRRDLGGGRWQCVAEAVLVEEDWLSIQAALAAWAADGGLVPGASDAPARSSFLSGLQARALRRSGWFRRPARR